MNINKLKSARVGNGLTQEEISSMLGMAIKTYNRKELGYVEFTRKEIFEIAKLLDLSLQKVNEIFFNNELTDRLSNVNSKEQSA